MKYKRFLVTGGTGFIGNAIVKRLIKDKHFVRILDNNFRGREDRLKNITSKLEIIRGDVRDAQVVLKACKGVDSIIHLAAVNGTEFFYSQPILVLEVGVIGIINVLKGAIKEKVPELIFASSSEVYQNPPIIPTNEKVSLSIPNVLNPRYCYGGSKIISELLVINYGRKYFSRAIIIRPHNVYGPDMGEEHVIPQFILRMHQLSKKNIDPIPFPIQGTGKETRSYLFIDDFVEGLMTILNHGRHLEIYNLGTTEEIAVTKIAERIGQYFGRSIKVIPGSLRPGSPLRRCPDITKLKKLGYTPKVPLVKGLPIVVNWYDKYAQYKSKRQ